MTEVGVEIENMKMIDIEIAINIETMIDIEIVIDIKIVIGIKIAIDIETVIDIEIVIEKIDTERINHIDLNKRRMNKKMSRK